jgi:hypothetical protein
MPVASALIGAGGSIVNGILGSNAASSAANAQVQAGTNALNQQQQQRNNTLSTLSGIYSTDTAALQPYQAAGSTAVSALQAGAANGGEFNSTPTSAQVMNEDPGYQFNLQQGQQAVERAEAAGGSVGSGGALKAASQYATNYTTNAYGQAYNQFLNTRQSNYSNLMGLAGMGQNANSQLISAGSTYGGQQAGVNENAANQESSLDTQIGNAQASGIMGSANALSGMTSSLANIGQGAVPFNASGYNPNSPAAQDFSNGFLATANNANLSGLTSSLQLQ